MNTKTCEICTKDTLHIAYRVQKEKGWDWIFVCGKCCLSLKKWVYYVYGGTWKSKEKRLWHI